MKLVVFLGMLLGSITAQTVVFRGVSDAVKDSTCSTTIGSPNLTCSDAPFSTCPTGKTVSVTDGKLETFNNTGNSLVTSIQGCSSVTVAVMTTTATNTTSNTSARWGTDNGPALFAQANAPTTNGKTFVIPSGNYLVRTFPGKSDTLGLGIDVYSNTSYVVNGHIYWVGPAGCDGNDPTCEDWGHTLIRFHDASENFGISSEWAPYGTHNVAVRVNGIIEGDWTEGSTATPGAWNGSTVAFIYGFGRGGAGDIETGVTNVTFDGSGKISNIYGFGYHSISGRNIAVRGLTFDRAELALNINGIDLEESHNIFHGNGSSAMETVGFNAIIVGNIFDNANVSLGGAGNNAVCSGTVFFNNIFSNMSTTNINAAMCLVSAVISNNVFWIPYGNTSGNATAINWHDGPDDTETRDNLVANNIYDGAPECYAYIVNFGVYTGANIYSGNNAIAQCAFGYLFYDGLTDAGGVHHPQIVKRDSLTSMFPGAEIAIATPQAIDVIRLQGASLDVGPVLPSTHFTNDSWYNKRNVGQVWASPQSRAGVGSSPSHPSHISAQTKFPMMDCKPDPLMGQKPDAQGRCSKGTEPRTDQHGKIIWCTNLAHEKPICKPMTQ